jgi:15-cis-phytoene synthase
MNGRLQHIFKSGSKTYFTSSLFFPPAVKEDVFKLYAFVRVADNLVDQVPPDREGFEKFVDGYRESRSRGPTGDLVIDSFVELAGRLEFDPAWTDAFLHSMALDLQKSNYKSLAETLEYVYGSAEVIGLYMARILGLPERAYPYAMLQGRAMQFINFIRDIREDQDLGRVYLPLDGRDPKLLTEGEARKKPAEFQAFIRSMLDHYGAWQEEAGKGYAYIPWRYLVPIKTAADMYRWTAGVIARDPFVVFSRQVKPSRGRILLTVFRNFFTLYTKRGRHHAGLLQGTKTENQ